MIWTEWTLCMQIANKYCKKNCLLCDVYLVLDFVCTQFSVVGKQIFVASPCCTTTIDLSNNYVLTRTEIHVPFQRKLIQRQIWTRTSITVKIIRAYVNSKVTMLFGIQYLRIDQHRIFSISVFVYGRRQY